MAAETWKAALVIVTQTTSRERLQAEIESK